MDQIKILVPIHHMPEIKSAKTLLYKDLVQVIRKKVEVKILWFVYQPEQIINSKKIDNVEEKILDIHDYKNALDVLEKERPNLICLEPTWDFICHSFNTAAKILKIPTLGEIYSSQQTIERSQTTLLKLYAKRFVENSTPTDSETDKKQFLKRGRFFIYKLMFMLKSLKASKMNILAIISDFFIVTKLTLSDIKGYENLDPKFANTCHWLEGESLVELLLKKGFKKSSIVVIGNPMYDKMFQRLGMLKRIKKDNKIRILFAPATMYEHGFWTKQQRDSLIIEILRELDRMDSVEITVKIHPSTGIFSEYEKLVSEVNPNIPIYHEGDIIDLIDSHDVLISFISGSTAQFYALLSGIPIILCNPYQKIQDIFVKKEVAYEAKYAQQIPPLIKEMSSKSIDSKKIENFVKEFFYKPDGQASERLSDLILNLVKK